MQNESNRWIKYDVNAIAADELLNGVDRRVVHLPPNSDSSGSDNGSEVDDFDFEV